MQKCLKCGTWVDEQFITTGGCSYCIPGSYVSNNIISGKRKPDHGKLILTAEEKEIFCKFFPEVPATATIYFTNGVVHWEPDTTGMSCTALQVSGVLDMKPCTVSQIDFLSEIFELRGKADEM